MNLRNFTLLLLASLPLHACSDTNARVTQMETSLMEVEEKVDALLTYSNTTHDAITDIDLRMEALEQDAKKRGVPVRIKGVDLAAAKAELDKLDPSRTLAPLIQPIPNISSTSDLNIPQPAPDQSMQEVSANQNALTHLAQDEQALLAQSPTLAAALQNNVQSPSSDLPEQDMSTPLANDGRRSQKLSEGYTMAEGISIRLPNTGDDFEYPEHTQTMEALENISSSNSHILENNTNNIGPITGQNLQAPLGTEVGDTLSPLLPVTPPTPSQSPYTADTIPEPVSLTPKPSQTANPAPITSPPAQASTSQTSTPASTNTYDGAMNLYKSRQYADSEKAFDAFLRANPNSPLAPNAIYWKGETYYARGLYPQAIFAFKEVQTRYPKHSKAPDSLLKTAMSYEKLGDTENANLHYTVLIEDFPSSSAAKRVPR